MPITKALITAAGRGTRFLPAVKSYAKELVPILNKPQIQYLVEEAIAAGITEICIVHRPSDTSLKNYFTPDSELTDYLTKINKLDAIESLQKIWDSTKLIFIPQDPTLPYGNASPILAAKSFIGLNPFVFMFGDDLTVEKEIGRYLKKMIAVFEQYHPAMVTSVKDVGVAEIERYGSAKYVDDPKYPNRISGMFEKLPADKAPSTFAQGGRYIIDSSKIIPILSRKQTGLNNELWLADGENILASTDVVLTVATDAESDWLTTGDPIRWLKANIVMAKNDPKFDI